jgi:hypothetical protein
MIDRRPALIARCSGAADVVHSVEFARSNDLLVAVRSGGHAPPARDCDGGLMTARNAACIGPRAKRLGRG